MPARALRVAGFACSVLDVGHEPFSVQQESSAALWGRLSRLAGAPVVDPAASALVDLAVAVLRRAGFDTLSSLPLLDFQPFAY
ncbi:hypothetical protein [Saccharopolyspora hattusasensis]|uniref:hypothetical protein n=1 Tax=Saccharopolyspora hattusasensis TaxID=1128679 RepID=UPI003D96AE17